MKKKLGILLVVVLFILASITLVSCTMFGGGSSTTERNEIKESHGYPFALEITSPAPSKSKAIGIDEFDLSMVKAKVRYAKSVVNEDGDDVIEYWVDDSSEFTLDNKNVEITNEWVLSDLDALAQEKNTVYVRYESNLKDEYGYNAELSGSFVLYLKQSETVSYSQIKFNLNGGIAGFAGSVNSDGTVSVTVRTGTRYTWSDFIATYPVTPPTGKALSAWGNYSSGSSISVDSNMELTAAWTSNFLNVSFDVNNASTDYTSAPVKPADQAVQIKDGFVARPQTKTMETFNGFDFVGWYKDRECTKVWNFTADLKGNEYTSSDNFTLYAKWEERKFTIKFNLMDGLLDSEQLQEIVTGEATTDFIIPTVDRSNFAVASYVTYTNDAGAVSYINITTTEKPAAKRLVFNNRQYAMTTSLAAGDYYFDYQNIRYYFSTSSALAKSDKGLQIGCAPATITYSDLKVGDKYFTKTQDVYTGGMLLATGVSNLETSKSIYKGLASFLDSSNNKIYFYEFKGWYTTPTFDDDALFTFANANGTSKEVVLGDYERSVGGFVLQLYAKWMVVDNEYRDLYLSDYLYKNSLSLKSDGTVAVNGVSDTSANIITIPKTIKYDFDGDGEFDKDAGVEINYVISEIGYKAFYGNSKVVEIVFDDDSEITTIGDGAFAYCTSLTHINIDALDNVTDIGSDILKGTAWLTEYREDHDYLVLNHRLIQYTGSTLVNEINMNTSEELAAIAQAKGDITVISNGAFAGLQKLIKIEILDSIETIENLAFQADSKLIIVDFTDETKISYVGESAFYQTAWVTGSNFVRATVFDENKDYYVATEDGFVDAAEKNLQPNSQADIDNPARDYFEEANIDNKDMCLILGNIYYRYTGSSNKAYTEAVIPEYSSNGFVVTKIAANAFSGYSNIKSIEFGNVKNIISIGQNAFADTTWATIGTGKAESYVETTANNSKGDPVTSATYISQDGFNVINGILVEYFGPASAASPAVIIPKNVKSIAKGVLSKNNGSQVTNILIPDGAILESIDDYAFIGATSLKGISFIDAGVADTLQFTEKAFFTSSTGVVANSFTFYYTLPTSGYADYDAYETHIKAQDTWKKCAVYSEFRFTQLVVETTEINPNAGIPTKYIINSADPNAFDIYAEWERLRLIVNNGEPTIPNGLKVTRNDGVSTLQDLVLESAHNYITIVNKATSEVKGNYKFSASDIPATNTYGEYAIKFTLQNIPYDSEYRFFVYPGISTAQFFGLEDIYYTSQKTLPRSGDQYYVKVTLYNGKVDYFRLDNTPFVVAPDGAEANVKDDNHAETCRIAISNYSYTKGTGKSLAISITYNGLYIYNEYSHAYSTVEAEVVAFEQASSFLFAANSNAQLKYSDCYFKLIYQDGSSKLLSMSMSNKFSVYQVFMETSNSYEEMDYLDTTDLGLRQAKIKYEGLDEPVTILYIVYIGTLPEVFTYDFKVVGGEYVATITGISSAFNNTYDATLVLPASVVRSESIDPLTYDNKEYKVVAIGDSAFKDRTKLTDIYIANTITSIGDYAFQGCNKLVNVYTFEMGENKSAGYTQYYLGPNNTNNCIEAYDEQATYYARAYITNINTKGAQTITVPYHIEGKSGVETIETNIKMEDTKAVYTGTTFTYDVSYSYMLTPIIGYSYEDILDGENNKIGEEFKCILSDIDGFDGVIYLPKTEYYKTLKQLVEENAGEQGLGYSIYLYEEGEANIPTATTNKFTYKGNSDTTSKYLNNLTFDIDMCYRTGNVVLLENAHLPIQDHQVYIPGHFNGHYEGSKIVGTETDTYEVYYDYTLTSVMDSCLHWAYTQGMTEVYVPYTIFNVWCDIDDFLLYATDMNTYMTEHSLSASNPANVQTAIDARTTENYEIVGHVSKYQYTAGALLTSNLVRDNATGAYVSHASTYDDDTAYAVARHFSSAVKEIGESAFEGCSELKVIDFTYATSLEEIGVAAFKDCVKLEAVDLSATKITSIEGSVFFDCLALKTVVIPKTVTAICGEAFHAAGIESFTVSGGTTTADLEIVSYAFHLVNGIDPTAFVTYLDSIYGTVNVGAEAFSQGE